MLWANRIHASIWCISIIILQHYDHDANGLKPKMVKKVLWATDWADRAYWAWSGLGCNHAFDGRMRSVLQKTAKKEFVVLCS